MGDADEFDRENAGFHNVSRLFFDKLSRRKQVVLAELSFKYSKRQSCAVYGYVQLLQQIRHCADVVLMTVSQEQTAYLSGVLFKICRVGYDKVNARHTVFGKSQSAVDDDDVVIVFENGHVLSDPVNSAKRYDAERRTRVFFCLIFFTRSLFRFAGGICL